MTVVTIKANYLMIIIRALASFAVTHGILISRWVARGLSPTVWRLHILLLIRPVHLLALKHIYQNIYW